MTLAEAVASLSVQFGEPAKSDGEACEVTSGGPRKDKKVEPVLCGSQSLAVSLWWRAMQDHLQGKSAWRITDGPHLDKWLITIMDAKGTQRVSEPRWSVTARVATGKAE